MNWKYQIGLNKAIDLCNDKFDMTKHEEQCPEEVKDILIAELKKAWPLEGYIDKVRKVQSIVELNRVLDHIYDRADQMKVWCGL